MAIVFRSGFLAAVASVQPFLAANGITATVEVGWKRRAHQTNQGPGGANRIVFTPSDDGGAGGSLLPARFPGNRNIRDPEAADPTKPIATVRSLLQWERAATVSVWAVDPTARESEAAQIEATETLFEWVVRAMHPARGAFASLQWGSVKWTAPPERAFGLELQASFTFGHPIYDSPRELVYPAAAAVSRGTYTPIPANDGDGDT